MNKQAQRPGFWMAGESADQGKKQFAPGHYAVSEPGDLFAIMASHPLAQLFTAEAGEHRVTATPMVMLPERDASGDWQLVGHMARRNPQAVCIENGAPATAVFASQGAYISPKWFRVTHTAPTWNYQSVQVRGRLEAIPGGEATMEVLRHTIALVESSAHANSATPPWSLAQLPAERASVLNGMITAFRLRIESIEGVERLNQDKHLLDILSIMGALGQSPQPGARQVVAAMAEKLGAGVPDELAP